MQYVCDAPGGTTWFRIETEAEAAAETELMRHAVEKHFRQGAARAGTSWDPAGRPFFERDIGRREHVRRTMPLFLTLRDAEGRGLATAMLPPIGSGDADGFRPIVVGPENADPYPDHEAAIRCLADHYGLTLERSRGYPYAR